MTPQEALRIYKYATTLLQAYLHAPSATKAPSLEKAIELYEAALDVLTEQDFPLHWATTMNDLAIAYTQLPTGDREINLQRAIKFYQNAVRVRTEQDFPVDWAGTMNNLAHAYRDLPIGDRRANLERAIECCQAALRIITEWDSPVQWAITMSTLADTYCDLPTGDRGANLKRAIECYEAVLRVRTEHEFPMDWAGTMGDLANAYRNLPTGDRGTNLQRAIEYYHATLRISTKRDANWAITMNNLAAVYSDLPTGDRADNLQRAIKCYQAALQILTKQDFPYQWAGAMNNLAIAYRDLPTGDRKANLEEAIKCHRAALRILAEQNSPAQWAGVMNDLATTYREIPAGDRGDNLKRAIECYEAALQVRTEREFPMDWAGTMNNLANAYHDLPIGDRSTNVKRAIEYYQAALRVLTERNSPAQWARTMSNLANAYCDLPAGDRKANLERAIKCHQVALRVLTKQDFPIDWAGTMSNLGNAYQSLPREDRRKNMEQAIKCYEKALQVRTEQNFPTDWAGTMNNLAVAYLNLQLGDRGVNLEQAIECLQATLRVLTECDFPGQWAMTMNNIALAYWNMPRGDQRENLEQAIKHHQAALRVYTEQSFPVEWATTMNNLANAYADLTTGDRRANLQQAIGCYQAALRVRTVDSLPLSRLHTLRNLGNLYFDDNAWQQALEYYDQAVTVTEQIRAAALREAERRRIFQESSAVFEGAVLSALRTAQPTLALTLTERGKTRNLADHIWQREAKPQGVSESEWQQYQVQLATAREWESDLSATSSVDFGPQLQRERGAVVTERHSLEELIKLRHSITEMEACFRQQDPGYLPFASPLEMKEIAELAALAGAVIVEFRVTREGTCIFLVGPDDREVTPEQVVEIQNLNDDALWQMLAQFEGSTPVDGWLVKYDFFRHRQLPLDEWLACVEQTTRELYERLLAQVHERLRQRYPETRRLILVPNKGLNLLPLHACWWEQETGERRYLLDNYEIAYTPSCQVLKRCLAREQANSMSARSLFAVQNPDPEDKDLKLPFSDWEVEEVCQFFPAEKRRVLAGSQATESAVKEHIFYGEEKLFSCHGLFDLTEVEKSRLGLHAGGSLSVRDIVPMDLRNTWLVVKSACETGLTDYRDIIDEYQGLPAAFLVAGAQTVVPSLWTVNDFSTSLLMQRFHANLYEHKMDKSSALCASQRWLRDLSVEEVQGMLKAKKQELTGLSKQGMAAVDVVTAQFDLKDWAKSSQGKPFANPYWWGAFQCVGAGWNPGGGEDRSEQ